MLGFKNKIYSFDPEALDDSMGLSENIIHKRKIVKGPNDIWTEVPPGRYDLIWDVRGDTSNNFEDYDGIIPVIDSEIDILYKILECPATSNLFAKNKH